MKNQQRRTDAGQKISFKPNLSKVFFNLNGHFRSHYQIQGTDGSNRPVLLCLGLLNVVLLITAVVLGVNCVKVREGSFHVSHSAVAPIINELNYLRSNHSDVIEAEEEAKNALERAVKNHTQLKEKIEKQKIINDNYQKQVEELQKERINLQSNMSALEGTCGRCLPGWVLHNSSCYYFSITESSTIRKNWPDSRADCIRKGADLIVIDNKEEQRFVSDCAENTKTEHYVFGDGFWIGLTDTKSKGTWVWINNVTEVEQRYWMDQEVYLMYDESLYSDTLDLFQEPDDVGSGTECGVAVYSSSSPWQTRYHVSCQHEYRHWMCEMTSS